jgi:ABC-type transporter Mla subunit MlaD
MNKGLIRDFLVGLTALVGATGLVITLMLVGELGGLTGGQYSFIVTMTNAAGITDTSPVTLNGVRVGQVRQTRVRALPETGAEIEVRVREGVVIPRNAKISINSSFVGDGTLEFSVPAGMSAQEALDVVKPGEVFDAGSPQTMFGRIEQAISGPIARFGSAVNKFEEFADTYIEVGKRVTDMLEPRTLEEVAQGKPANVRSTVARLDVAIANANAWLEDEALRTQIRDTVAKAPKVMDEVAALTKAWQQTAADLSKTSAGVDTSVERITQRLDEISLQTLTMLRTAEKAAGEMAATLETARSGPGTMGQLMQNPDLYRSLKDASDRLNKTLEEVQLMVEKFKAEGVPLKL